MDAVRVGPYELAPWRSRVLRFTVDVPLELQRHFAGPMWSKWFEALLRPVVNLRMGEIPMWVWPLNRGDCAVPAGAELWVVVLAMAEAPLNLLVERLAEDALHKRDEAVRPSRRMFSDYLHFRDAIPPNATGPPDVAHALLDPAGWLNVESQRLLSSFDNDEEGQFVLHILTPLRLLRPKAEIREGHNYLDEFWFAPEVVCWHAWLRIWRVYCQQTGNKRGENYPQEPPEPLPSGLTVCRQSLMWIDAPYRTAIAEDKTIGGVQGEIEFRGRLSEFWLRVMLTAGWLHVGPSIAMGLGRLGLTSSRDIANPRWPTTPDNLHHRLATIGTLGRVRDRMRQIDGEPGIDGVVPADISRADDRWLGRLATELCDGAYSASPLRLLNLAKPDGSSRQVVVPTARDRMLQRAAVEVLAHSIDLLLSVASFGFRMGLNRQSAVDALQQARADGFTVGIQTDIAAFFDSVAWDDVESRLRSVFGRDPIVDLLMAWVRAPVQIGGVRIERTRGLPQGLPISPMLANLVLDRFDRELLAIGFRLFRYSDDFILLSRPGERIGNIDDGNSAALAHRVQQALSPLGLAIRPDKTRPIEPNMPITFLGLRVVPQETTFEVPTDIAETLADDDEEPTWAQFGAAVREATGRPRTLYVGGTARYMRCEGTDVVLADGNRHVVHRQPWSDVARIVTLGRVGLTGAILQQAMRRQIPISVLNWHGQLLGEAVPAGTARPGVVAAQQARLADGEWCLNVARALVEVRIRQMRERMRRHDATTDEMRQFADDARRAPDFARLLGIEGAATRAYWAIWPQLVAPFGFEFPGRQRRPPPDPVNAMISLLSTLLYHRIAETLRVFGFDPRMGIYHQSHGAHAALASDLIEEIRHIPEGIVLRLIRRKQVQPADFPDGVAPRTPDPATGRARGYYLPATVYRTVVLAFEDQLLATFTLLGRAGREISWGEFLDEQVRQFRAAVMLPQNYRPLLMPPTPSDPEPLESDTDDAPWEESENSG